MARALPSLRVRKESDGKKDTLVSAQSSRNVSHVVISNALVFLATLLGVVIANQSSLTAKQTINIVYILLIGCCALLFLEYARVATSQLIQARREAESAQRHAEGVDKSLPTFVRITKRSDKFILSRNGSATLLWDFEIDGAFLDEPVNELLFPVAAEIDYKGGLSESVVEVKRLAVDGNLVSTRDIYEPLEVRRPFRLQDSGLNQAMEFGVLRVPVRLGVDVRRCRIELELLLKGAFSNLLDREYAIVDVPYITEDVHVVVEAEAGGKIRPLSAQAEKVVANIGIVEIRDPGETHRQDKMWKVEGDRFVWHAEYPKLGYTYKLFFWFDPGDQGKAPVGPGRKSSA